MLFITKWLNVLKFQSSLFEINSTDAHIWQSSNIDNNNNNKYLYSAFLCICHIHSGISHIHSGICHIPLGISHMLIGISRIHNGICHIHSDISDIHSGISHVHSGICKPVLVNTLVLR